MEERGEGVDVSACRCCKAKLVVEAKLRLRQFVKPAKGGNREKRGLARRARRSRRKEGKGVDVSACRCCKAKLVVEAKLRLRQFGKAGLKAAI